MGERTHNACVMRRSGGDAAARLRDAAAGGRVPSGLPVSRIIAAASIDTGHHIPFLLDFDIETSIPEPCS